MPNGGHFRVDQVEGGGEEVGGDRENDVVQMSCNKHVAGCAFAKFARDQSLETCLRPPQSGC